ncbi:MAG: (2Fe-2S)-binding protein [Rhodobacteraceae bacterium]|nr:(2Fe-2S)-binding protein [Paracoccaceae bacterium]
MGAIILKVNGQERRVEVAPGTTLLVLLRNHLGLRGTRFGCGLEQCGACTVLVDGAPVPSCTRPVEEVAGRAVTTIEGLAREDRPDPLLAAFLAEQAGQCGYCLAGIIVGARALLDRNPRPTRAEIVAALDRHLCRCGAHPRIIRAVERAAAEARAGHG